jgi:hypothetical protein
VRREPFRRQLARLVVFHVLLAPSALLMGRLSAVVALLDRIRSAWAKVHAWNVELVKWLLYRARQHALCAHLVPTPELQMALLAQLAVQARFRRPTACHFARLVRLARTPPRPLRARASFVRRVRSARRQLPLLAHRVLPARTLR